MYNGLIKWNVTIAVSIQCGPLSCDTSGGNKCFGIAPVIKRRDDDTILFGSGMNEFSVTQVDAYVRDRNASFFIGKEKEQVALLQVFPLYNRSFFGLLPCGPWQVDVVFSVKVLYIA